MKIEHEQRKWLIGHLRGLANRSVTARNTSYGICFELKELRLEGEISAKDRTATQLLIEEWPEHSGIKVFPVGHEYLEPEDAFFNSSPELIWVQGEYAEARRRLCDWLADQLEKTL